MKIGFLGGSFDPVHAGHLAIAHRAVKTYHLDRCFWIPAFQSPHKTASAPKANAFHRLEMIRLAIAQEPCFEVSDLEIKRGGVSYAVETLREFQIQFPGAECYWILGADAYRGFSTWKDHEEILQKAFLIVAPRPGETIVSKSERVLLLSSVTVPVSSTEIRAAIEKGKDVSRDSLPEGVRQYILKHRLYQQKV